MLPVYCICRKEYLILDKLLSDKVMIEGKNIYMKLREILGMKHFSQYHANIVLASERCKWDVRVCVLYSFVSFDVGQP